jgi:hypothetical protein
MPRLDEKVSALRGDQRKDSVLHRRKHLNGPAIEYSSVVKQLKLASLLIAVCCAAPEPQPTGASAPPATTTHAPAVSTTQQKREEIQIDSVVATNPLLVRGHARTFENTVSLRVRDARGDVIAEEFVTSAGEMGQHNPFEAQLWVTRDPRARVVVEAFESSAKDGTIQSLVRKELAYPVALIPAKLMFPVGDCTTISEFTRRLPKSIAMARLLAEALLAGPVAAERSAGATSPFPPRSDIRSVTLRGGEVTVDFSENLQNVGGSCAALAIRESVEQTLEQLPTVRRVTITAGGSRELALQP